tara:strand:- start:3394 stop:3978 length:585 start_codon:yes stop_codon:yes gene_type:complete
MKKVVIGGLVVLLAVLIGCSGSSEGGETAQVVANDGSTGVAQTADSVNKDTGWRDFEIKDINSGDTFKISDFAGQKIVLESFAVWCPTCTKQQREIRKLAENGDTSVHIALDTDPNEDEQAVRDHTKQNGFDWRYAVAPAEMTKLLIDEFGVGFVNAPSAPVAIICEDQSGHFLPRGVKKADRLAEELVSRCSG